MTTKKLIDKLTSWTLISALIHAVQWTYYYIKDYMLVNESMHSDAFYNILKKYLRMDPRTDWLGRVYGVVNPSIDEDGNFDFNGMVFEVDGINTNNRSWVENWLYKQMILVDNVFGFQQNGMFDILGATVKHVGPKNADNYLIVFDIVSRKEMSKRWKRVLMQSAIYGIIGALVWMVAI